MEFRVLGPVEVRLGGRVEALSGRLQRILLGVLLVRANQPVPVDVLTDALWGEQPDPRAGQKLQLHVHRLRGLLDDPDRLSFGPAGYRLRVDVDEVDAARFEALVTAGAETVDREPQRAIESLRAALALWRADPFADVAVPAVADWAHRLTATRLAGIEALYQAQLAVGLHEAVIAELGDLVAEHPVRERLYGLLMTALHRAGRTPEALDVYERARRTLVAELGVDPGPELRAVHADVVAGERPPAADVPAYLPGDVRGFAGRDAELAELDGLSSSERAPLVVVAGTAGVGKTALALHWAHRVRDRFPDGQLYVDLRGYGPEEPLAPADALAGFLRALGLDGAAIPEDLGERAARFRTMVDQRRMLVLLDNARTVEQVRPLLPAGPTCFTLVTSRDALAGLVARDGAHRLGLDRLPMADAVRLLRDLLGPRADLDPAAVDALAERCARLPLALRITAELVRSRPGRTVGELAGELAQAQDALDLLDVEGDPHTAVRAVFSWSYRKLEPAVARTFRLLGLHPGHDTDAHAMAAMADVPLRATRQALGTLVRAHLVDETSAGRYRAHDLLRAYAAELAQATEQTGPVTRLRAYYLATASAAMDVLAPYEAERRPKVDRPACELPVFDTYEAAMDWLRGERDNLLTVAQHAEPRYVVTMSDTVWRFITTGGYHDDGMRLYQHALEAARSLQDPAAEANAHRVIGSAKLSVGLVAQAADHLGQALAGYRRLGHRSFQAATLNNIGVTHWRLGDLSAAQDTFRQALAIYTELGNRRMRMAATSNLARLRNLLGHHDEAYALLEQALVIARENDNRPGESSVLAGMAHARFGAGRLHEALDYAQRALAMARAAGHRSFEGTSLRCLGITHHGLGEHATALRHLDAALRTTTGLGEPEELMATLTALARVHASLRDQAEALRCYREALATENAREHPDEYAHALAGLGDTHATLGEHDQAREHWRQALVLYRDLGMPQAGELATRLDRAVAAEVPPGG